MRRVREQWLAVALMSALCGLPACGREDRPEPTPSLQQVADSVAREIVAVLPDGAMLARPVSRGDVGLGDSFVLVWRFADSPGFSAGVVVDGQLHELPSLHGDRVPWRIGGVMAVQVDADPAGELVILLDYTEARPERRMAPARRPFEPVVVDHGPRGFVRVPELEAAVSGLSGPNEIREELQKKRGGAP